MGMSGSNGGNVNGAELAALRLVADSEPVVPCHIRHEVNWWILRDLALADLIVMRNTDGEWCNPWDIEFAVNGGWLGVALYVTDNGRAVLS